MRDAPILEICVDDPEGLDAAIAGGAQRIELCAALALGGLTPAPGLVAQAAAGTVPIFAMIRPRPGGFIYTPAEIRAGIVDILAMRDAGLAGIVLGATLPDGRLDPVVIGEWRDAAQGLPMVLHRAFDLAPDPFEALEQAIGMGFCRIMTSGGAATALQGATRIGALARQAAGRIGIMAGGGIEAADAAPLLSAGADDLHASCSELREDPATPGVLRIAAARQCTSETKVRELLAAMRQG